jgi:LemA protein
MIIDFVMLAILAIGAAVAISLYNGLVAMRRRCDQAEADIEVQLRQRNDLIPNLVETVKGYAAHERGTLTDVMAARNAAVAAAPGQARAQAEAALTGALGRLFAVAEAYPDLKASANFAALQDELSDIENKIAASRRFLNAAVTEYNVSREQFPANLFADAFKFAPRATPAVSPDQRAKIEVAPSVKF